MYFHFIKQGETKTKLTFKELPLTTEIADMDSLETLTEIWSSVWKNKLILFLL